MELRKDYILDRWVIVAEGRGKRPSQFVTQKAAGENDCVFCAGHEKDTPPELYRIEKNGKWNVRVIPNKYSAVDPMGDPNVQTHNKFYTFAGDHGKHEVVIETPDHGKNFGDLSEQEMVDIIKTYASRINTLSKEPVSKYVCLFKNQGKDAGASIKHPHSQIISMSMLPPELAMKIDAVKKHPSCPYCEIIQKEKDSYRRCFENDFCVAFTPYASRFNYEVIVLPKQHIRNFDEMYEGAYWDLARILKKVCHKIEEIDAPYDMAWYYSPNGENLHFHIEIMPRIALWAGFEMGFGVTINTVSPEEAAKFYRGES